MTRIPIPITIGVSLAVIAAVWWLGTRDKDFMVPHGGQFALADLSPGFDSAEEPTPRAVVPVNLNSSERAGAMADDAGPRNFLELGDLETSPGLSEYSEHASKGVAYFIKLATELEARGEFQRALLAWERVLDSCKASSEERTMASSAVIRIRPTLPRWNIDPLATLPLTLEIGSTRPDSPELREAAYRLKKFLEADSGDQVQVHTRITANPSDSAPADGPIAIAITGPAESTEDVSLVRSAVPEGNETSTLYRAFLAEAYILVAHHLGTLPEYVPPGAPAYPDDPERDFHFQITRLHWRTFARSLSPAPAADFPRVEFPEED